MQACDAGTVKSQTVGLALSRHLTQEKEACKTKITGI